MEETNTMFKNKSVYIAKVEHASRLLPGDGKRAGRSFYLRPVSFHKWYNTPLLAAFGNAEIVGLKRLSLRNLSADGGQVSF